MELTRRDALKALATGTGAAGTSVAVSELLATGSASEGPKTHTDEDIETLALVAEVIYPSEISVNTEFIETYLRGLTDEKQGAISRTVTQLDTVTRSRYGTSFSSTSNVSRRDSMLRSLGVHRVRSTPDGTVPAQIRYHLVNTLLYALFTSPTGSELVGIRSPRGHPGGFASYRVENE